MISEPVLFPGDFHFRSRVAVLAKLYTFFSEISGLIIFDRDSTLKPYKDISSVLLIQLKQKPYGESFI